MNLMHERVCHPQFGEGVITEQSEKHILAEFSNGETKKFMYPQAFEKHLTLCSEKLQEEMKGVVTDCLNQRALQTRQQIENLAQKREDVRQELLEQKKGAARKTSAAAAAKKKIAVKEAAEKKLLDAKPAAVKKPLVRKVGSKKTEAKKAEEDTAVL